MACNDDSDPRKHPENLLWFKGEHEKDIRSVKQRQHPQFHILDRKEGQKTRKYLQLFSLRYVLLYL